MPWPVTFLYLIAEGGVPGTSTAWSRPPHRAAQADRRSRLPDAADAALRVPVLTPSAPALRLRIAPQTGHGLVA